MGSINDRLSQIVNNMFADNAANFGKAIGASKGTVSNYVRSKENQGKTLSKPGFDFLQKVVNSLDIDANWLLTGKGQMHRKETPDPDAFNQELIEVCKALIANYQQRDEVMSQLISMVKQME